MKDTVTGRFIPVPAIDRFWGGVIVQPSGCWEWQGCFRKGYGLIGINGKTVTTHRFAFEALKEIIPKGLEIDHLCRNTKCVNPNHLEAVTHQENVLRGFNGMSAKTHCPKGHPYNEENTYYNPRGGRVCRICHRAVNRGWKRRWKLRNSGAR